MAEIKILDKTYKLNELELEIKYNKDYDDAYYYYINNNNKLEFKEQ